MAQNWDEIEAVATAFVNASSREESKRIVEERRGVLLTDAADRILADLLTQYRGHEQYTRIPQEHRAPKQLSPTLGANR